MLRKIVTHYFLDLYLNDLQVLALINKDFEGAQEVNCSLIA